MQHLESYPGILSHSQWSDRSTAENKPQIIVANVPNVLPPPRVVQTPSCSNRGVGRKASYQNTLDPYEISDHMARAKPYTGCRQPLAASSNRIFLVGSWLTLFPSLVDDRCLEIGSNFEIQE
ncbi:hypothetical protein CNMCM7691_008978 [Aspergillus felis]|uniref:Uncharacterized protein n=1 Tax=Aspergillus felis TaxID=1287682 RepID=A0A8H6QTM6_9EURO|nr:hypothetical protein CNMCM7691_008978 [Aspergillus felis]